MKTKKISVFPDELLKVKEIDKKQRWNESSGLVLRSQNTFTDAERANLLQRHPVAMVRKREGKIQ